MVRLSFSVQDTRLKSNAGCRFIAVQHRAHIWITYQSHRFNTSRTHHKLKYDTPVSNVNDFVHKELINMYEFC